MLHGLPISYHFISSSSQSPFQTKTRRGNDVHSNFRYGETPNNTQFADLNPRRNPYSSRPTDHAQTRPPSYAVAIQPLAPRLHRPKQHWKCPNSRHEHRSQTRFQQIQRRACRFLRTVYLLRHPQQLGDQARGRGILSASAHNLVGDSVGVYGVRQELYWAACCEILFGACRRGVVGRAISISFYVL